MLLLLIVFLPFVGSVLAVLLPTHARNQEAWLSGIIALVVTIAVLYQAPQIFQGAVIDYQIEWIPSLSLSFHLRMDGFAWLFALLVAAMGALVVLYARYYMDPADPVPRFFSFFLIFMGAMLGLVLSGNVIQLVIFWELTSLASFMLISYWYHRADARRGARMSFTVTATGGLFLLASMLMLGNVVGSYELSDILKAGSLIRNNPIYVPIIITFAVGVLTKSAQFPFQFWLPNAMAAPTPVSAYLHSATMVKAGVFAIARFWPVLSGSEIWFWIFAGSGLLSLVIAAYIAIFQKDIKGVLAYSTISHLGLITLLLGLNSDIALVVAVFHMINHATFKASLFMATGIVDHETGTRDITVLSGLRKVMPITATLAIVAAAAMAGVPLLNGFISKEMFFSETLFVGVDNYFSYVLPIAAVVASTFSVAYSYRFISEVFFNTPDFSKLPKRPHEPPLWMIVPSAVLVFCCLIVGIFPQLTIGPVLSLAVSAILGKAHVPEYSLAIWHGFNIPLLMSFMALVGGLILALILRNSLQHHPGQTPLLNNFKGRDVYDKVINGINNLAYIILQCVSSRRLQVQTFLIVCISFLVALLPIVGKYPIPKPNLHEIQPSFLILWLVGSVCAIGAAYQAKYNRFRSLVMMGGVGIITVATYAWMSAPDLALTQIVVEIVTVILILLGLRWLPRTVFNFAEENETIALLRRGRDFIISCCVGFGISILAYFLMMRPPTQTIREFFINKALPEGGGTNVVNVILVDFRGFDTYGEITVLAIVGITVYALLRRFRPPQEMIHALEKRQNSFTPDLCVIDENNSLPTGTLLVPNVLARLLMPAFSLMALFFFFRGHNLPGGGFVGGLIFAIGILVQFIISGIHWVEENSRIRPQNWLAAGLLLPVISGMLPWLYGKPFLSAVSWGFDLPFIGHVHLSSVILFDWGVFCLVVGCTTYMLVALAHQSLRFHRQSALDAEASQKAPTIHTSKSQRAARWN